MRKIITLEDFKKLKVGDQFIINSMFNGKDEHATLQFKSKTLKYPISDADGSNAFRYGDDHKIIYAKDCDETGKEKIIEWDFSIEFGSLGLTELDFEDVEFIEKLNIRKLSRKDPRFSITDQMGSKMVNSVLNMLFKN